MQKFKIMKSISFFVILIILHGAIGQQKHISTDSVSARTITDDLQRGKYN